MKKFDSDQALGGLGDDLVEADDLQSYFAELCKQALHDKETLNNIDYRRGRTGNWRNYVKPYQDKWSALSKDKKQYIIAQAYLFAKSEITEYKTPYYI